ncbi:MAG: hypothetical protein SFX72_14245 [Isosphaeraceae bacterium]|nr:hypothetical protein [Isosphaeraceae bacterium]
MSTRKHPSRFRAVRPSPEGLEERRMLSTTISGVDGDGDTWTLRLVGPGALRVIRQPDSTGAPTPYDEPGQIDTIEIAGTFPLLTKLVGTVERGPDGDGRVFFQQLRQLSNRAQAVPNGNGLVAINLPNFWLGLTSATGVTTATVPSIEVPDGVNTLRFGGVDVTAFFGQDPSRALNRNNQNDRLTIDLGLPQHGGTRVVVDRMISDAQAAVGTGQPTQDSIAVTVDGRISLFQANEIVGNTQIPSQSFGTSGGTLVTSVTDPVQGITGQIGYVRVGGNATNFAVTTNDKMANFFVGGETNNVSILTPAGSRNLYFGKGLDTTTILTNSIQSLQANRGALNSRVISSRQIGQVVLGGDVSGTLIQSGYVQQLESVFQNPANIPDPVAQAGGRIHITIAGNVTESVIAASVEPFEGTFGGPFDLELPGGAIKGKIEGAIDNTDVTPESPNTAFYAGEVRVFSGPVIPPNVPEAPYPRPISPLKLPGVPNLASNNRYLNAAAARALSARRR